MNGLFHLREWELREKFLNMNRHEQIVFARENDIGINVNMNHKQLVDHLTYEIYMLGVKKRKEGKYPNSWV